MPLSCLISKLNVGSRGHRPFMDPWILPLDPTPGPPSAQPHPEASPTHPPAPGSSPGSLLNIPVRFTLDESHAPHLDGTSSVLGTGNLTHPAAPPSHPPDPGSSNGSHAGPTLSSPCSPSLLPSRSWILQWIPRWIHPQLTLQPLPLTLQLLDPPMGPTPDPPTPHPGAPPSHPPAPGSSPGSLLNIPVRFTLDESHAPRPDGTSSVLGTGNLTRRSLDAASHQRFERCQVTTETSAHCSSVVILFGKSGASLSRGRL